MSRIYKVNTPKGERLVDAPTKGQAIKHCVTDDYTAIVVGASEMYDLIQKGATVEKAATNEQPAHLKKAAGKKPEKSTGTAPKPSAPAIPEATPTGITPAATPAAATGGTPLNPVPLPVIEQPQSTPAAAPVNNPNPVLAEQQQINPNAAAAATQGLPPPALAPTGGPVDWEARERATN